MNTAHLGCSSRYSLMRLASRVHADIDETLSWRHSRELEIRLSEGEAECQAKERQPKARAESMCIHEKTLLSADVAPTRSQPLQRGFLLLSFCCRFHYALRLQGLRFTRSQLSREAYARKISDTELQPFVVQDGGISAQINVGKFGNTFESMYRQGDQSTVRRSKNA